MAISERMEGIYDSISNAFPRDENTNFYKITEELIVNPIDSVQEDIEYINNIVFPEVGEDPVIETGQDLTPWSQLPHDEFLRTWGRMLGITNQYDSNTGLGNYTTARGIAHLLWSKFENAGGCTEMETSGRHIYQIQATNPSPKYTNELYSIYVIDSSETKVASSGSMFTNGSRGLNHQFEVVVQVLFQHGSAIAPSVLSGKYLSIIHGILDGHLPPDSEMALTVELYDDSTYTPINDLSSVFPT